MSYKNKEKERARTKRYYEAHKEEINAHSRAYCAAHREKQQTRSRAYRKTYREKINAKQKVRGKIYRENHKKEAINSSLKYKYGITLAERNIMLSNQNDQCAICNKELEGRDICIDHDHETKKVRGILCSQCNCMLGNANDNSSILANAIKYIDSSKGSVVTSGKTDA